MTEQIGTGPELPVPERSHLANTQRLLALVEQYLGHVMVTGRDAYALAECLAFVASMHAKVSQDLNEVLAEEAAAAVKAAP